LITTFRITSFERLWVKIQYETALNLYEGKIFRTFPDRPWGPPSLVYNGYQVFPEGKKRPGRDADPSPPSSAVFKKG